MKFFFKVCAVSAILYSSMENNNYKAKKECQLTQE